MNRLKILVKGEFVRLNKYNLFIANFVVLLVWIVLAYFLEGEELKSIIPFIFLMDSTMMTILLVGATMFYEKKEHTINTMMISPVKESEYILSKIIVNILNSIISVIFISAAIFFMKNVTYNYGVLILAVIVVSAVHTLIGIWFSYYAKDFTSMLINFMIYTLVFLFPTLLANFNVINPKYSKYFIIFPPEASNILISRAVGEVETWKIIFSFSYLIILSFVIYKYIVKPKFNDYVIRETGV